MSATLAQEIFQNPQLHCKKSLNWTASEKAHLYSYCLFAARLQHAKFPLRLKEIPYAGTLLEVDEKISHARVLSSRAIAMWPKARTEAKTKNLRQSRRCTKDDFLITSDIEVGRGKKTFLSSFRYICYS